MIGLLDCIFSTKEVAASQSLPGFKCEVDAQDESVLICIKRWLLTFPDLFPEPMITAHITKTPEMLYNGLLGSGVLI